MESHAIFDKQGLCKCLRGHKVRYYCAQEICQLHLNDIFLCDICFQDLMKKEPHKLQLINVLFEELKAKWADYIDKVEKIYAVVNSKVKANWQLNSWLYNASINQGATVRHNINEDWDYFANKLYQELKGLKSTFMECSQTLDVVKLHYNNSWLSINQETFNKLSYLADIVQPDFLYDLYKPCIKDCQIPLEYDLQSLRKQILAFKVRLAEENITAAKAPPKLVLNPQEIQDTVMNLKYAQAIQDAQLEAIISLFGNIKGASKFVNMSLSQRNYGLGGPQQLNQVEQEKNLDKLDKIIEEINEVYQTAQGLKRENRAFEERQTQINIAIGKSMTEFKEIQRKYQIDMQSLQNQFKCLNDTQTNQIKNHNQYSKAQNFAISKPVFKQEFFDDLISTLNSPWNDYNPVLNKRGQSQLSEYILEHGWKWSPQVQQIGQGNRSTQWVTFEGQERGSGWYPLQKGFYYGQMIDGQMDGFGILYCTDAKNTPWLYECEWKQGIPINEGRYIFIKDNKWTSFEGTMDESYLLTGEGRESNEDGRQYAGSFKKGRRHGKGTEMHSNGLIVEGQWLNNLKQV
ncbi:hypothetical protein FGO68_gene13408 [Halteria grandinella]|uniref:Uncharacterized protein n=1 Tax=Halteria grandinella TaxID=5974 RepID=A0A8J8T3Q2_HALGN|nr:hypothetical protein FGO68_gene13408 [Halteria grandinella]